MYTNEKISKEFHKKVELLSQLEGGAVNLNDLEATRKLHRAFIDQALHAINDDYPVATNDIHPPSIHRAMRIYRPAGLHYTPALLWIHGGGMVTGFMDQDEQLLRHICHMAGVTIFSVDYRLAPEHPYPTPLNDCYEALCYMHNNAQSLNIDPQRLSIGGASAGAGLAAGLALKARDIGDIPVTTQILLYPMIDDTNVHPADELHPDTFSWNRENNRYGWAAYLDELESTDKVPSYAAPIRETNLTNLPPTFIAVGTVDLFLNENLIYAQNLLKAGVSTELHVYPGAIHGFVSTVPEAPMTQSCVNSIISSLNRSNEKNA